MKAISNALAQEGILILPIGQCLSPDAPPIEYTTERALETSFLSKLLENGFERVRFYEEMHGGFKTVRGYMVAFKDASNLENWHKNQALFDLMVHERVLLTKPGDLTLQYFDGATMLSLALGSRRSAGRLR